MSLRRILVSSLIGFTIKNASRFWASVRDLWPLVAFVTLVSSVIIGDTFIGMAKELDARRKEKAC